MSLILDSSVTLAWLLGEETTSAVQTVFDRIVRAGAWVPSLWRLEVANTLHMAARRKRVTEVFRDDSLTDLDLLPISIDPETDRQAWGTTVQLATSSGLTVNDASYLELAIRRHLPLATLDRELRVAAKASGVKLLGV
jgi:predicted nucleic acid-binding protein